MIPQAVTDTSTTAPLSQTIAHIAHVLAAEGFPTGERARLKRWSPGSPPSLAFYRFAFQHLPDQWEHQPETWLTLVTGLALMCPSPHRRDLSVGRALAETGYAEARLERLLAAHGNALPTLILRAARFLRAKNASCNWTDFAYLLDLAGSPEEVRLRIARDYYRHQLERVPRDGKE